MFVHQSRSKLVNSAPWLLISCQLNADDGSFWLRTSPDRPGPTAALLRYWLALKESMVSMAMQVSRRCIGLCSLRWSILEPVHHPPDDLTERDLRWMITFDAFNTWPTVGRDVLSGGIFKFRAVISCFAHNIRARAVMHQTVKCLSFPIRRVRIKQRDVLRNDFTEN